MLQLSTSTSPVPSQPFSLFHGTPAQDTLRRLIQEKTLELTAATESRVHMLSARLAESEAKLRAREEAYLCC